MHSFDEIWVLSAESQFALQFHGITSRIVRFPLEIKNSFLPVSYENQKYFLTFIDFNSDFDRKNPISTILAFREAFALRENVNLLIKVSNYSNDLENYSLLEDMCKIDDRIILLNKTLSNQEISNLFYNCLAFISSHRAEGLGLNIVEAIIHLKPAVVSKYSAPTEYLPNTYHYFVSGTLIPIKSHSTPYNLPGAEWFEPDINEIAKFLNEIFSGKVLHDSVSAANMFMIKYFDELDDNSLRKNLLRMISNNR
jgi:glycosyltransferase involved in cell wall biosynthesis